jgi:streptogramin lyase
MRLLSSIAIVHAFLLCQAAEIRTLNIPGLKNPYGLCLGPDEALYICDIDNHVIWRVKDHEARVVAGNRTLGYSGDNGPATQAQLNEPYEVRFDPEGNMFFVEMRNHLVRRISAKDGTISTIAGTGKPGFSGDGGTAIKAQLNQPHSIQLDGQGNLYICDIGNHRIRKVELKTGNITTFAGTGEKKPTADRAPISGSPLNGPRALDFDKNGDIWLALREGNAIYRFDEKAHTIHHVVTNGLAGPKGISIGPDGHIYFADTESHSIRKVDRITGKVQVIAGTGTRGDGPDGDPLKCALARPHGIFVVPNGDIYIGDSENNKVRVISLP